MFVGVSGLSAQSQAMSAVSNNIANVNTTGYKQIDVSFGSIVTTQTNSGKYSPGSVQAIRQLTVNQQGAIQQTSSATDTAIIGNGMFVVQKNPVTSSFEQKMYTRSGSFQEDGQGFLRNETGFYLMGWPLDTNGNLPAAQADPSSLVPVDVAFLGGLTKATTSGSLGINLDANQQQADYPLSASTPTHFGRGLRVYDTLGQRQDLEFQFTKHNSPTASAITNTGTTSLTLATQLTSLADIEAGEEINIDVDGNTETFTISSESTVQDFISFINNNPVLGSEALATLNDNGQVKVTAINLGVSLNITDGAITSGDGAATSLGFSVTAAPTVPNVFPGGISQLRTDPNPNGWWKLEIVNASNSEILSTGHLNFQKNGQVNSLPDAEGDIKIALQDIEWGNGAERQDIDVNIRNISQFGGAYNVIFAEQDGAELGLRTGVEINSDGIVSARFSNGQSAELYKIPVATFTNPNGLVEESGNIYTETRDAGSFNLREPGAGGAGTINGGALEVSNVDLAEEFAKIITIQRSYSANTKVISTADEMTEELLRIK
jgi:flagellar hook protein FlgE